MKLRPILEILSLFDKKKFFLSSIALGGGIGLMLLTLYAQHIGDVELANVAAGASLVFVLLIVIFVIPPLARSARREASQMNFPVELTIGGAIFVGLIVVIAFLAIALESEIAIAALSILLAFVVVDAFGLRNIKKLEIKLRFPESVFADEKTPVWISIGSKRRFFPSHGVHLAIRGKRTIRSAVAEEISAILPERFADKLAPPSIIDKNLGYFRKISPNEHVEMRSDLQFDDRGRFIVCDFELTSLRPFAIFLKRRRLHAQETEIAIYPRRDGVFSAAVDDEGVEGEFVRTHGGDDDLFSLRELNHQDDSRKIDWKATARVGKPLVRDGSAGAPERFLVFFVNRLPKDARPKLSLRERLNAERKGERAFFVPRFENAVNSVAAALTQIFNSHGEFGLGIEKLEEINGGRPKLLAELRRLALLDPDFSENAGENTVQLILQTLPALRDEFAIIFAPAELRGNFAGISSNARLYTY